VEPHRLLNVPTHRIELQIDGQPQVHHFHHRDVTKSPENQENPNTHQSRYSNQDIVQIVVENITASRFPVRENHFAVE
jgi:hypothetical protein